MLVFDLLQIAGKAVVIGNGHIVRSIAVQAGVLYSQELDELTGSDPLKLVENGL